LRTAGWFDASAAFYQPRTDAALENTVRLWDVGSGRPQRALQGHSKLIPEPPEVFF